MESAFDLEKWLRGAGIKDEKIGAVATVLRAEDVDTPENLVTLTDSALQTLGLTMGQPSKYPQGRCRVFHEPSCTIAPKRIH